MTDLQVIIEALSKEAADCHKCSTDPKNSHAIQQEFWWQKQHLERVISKIRSTRNENPTDS